MLPKDAQIQLLREALEAVGSNSRTATPKMYEWLSRWVQSGYFRSDLVGYELEALVIRTALELTQAPLEYTPARLDEGDEIAKR